MVYEQGTTYYPVSYLSEKVLLRKDSILSKNFQKQYEKEIKYFGVDFSFVNGGTQETKHIPEIVLKEILGKTKVGRLDTQQKKAQNELHKYLGLELLSEDEKIVEHVDINKTKQYEIFIQDAINDVLAKNPNVSWQQCTKCNRYYPLVTAFFRENRNSSKFHETVCRNCIKINDTVVVSNPDLTYVYRKYGEEVYIWYRDHETIKIYNHCVSNDLKLPSIIQKKDDYLEIIKYLYKYNKIKQVITYKYLINEHRLINAKVIITLDEVYKYLCGEDYKYYPWKNKNIPTAMEHNNEYAKEIMTNYIRENNIEISDVFEFRYGELMMKAKIRTNDLLGLIVDFYDHKYAGYKFKINSKRYYTDKENRTFDLKYMIEEDLNIPLDKIPLYLTISTFQKLGTATMYHSLKKYYKSLFEWVDEVYPNKFIETDFNLNIIRNQFDSIEEGQIHQILKENLNNVIYNCRNTENTVKINGMIPDWLVVDSSGCWLIEYFGMYLPKHKYNERVSKYMDKTERKIRNYEKIKNYGKVFLFPTDLENGYRGVLEKMNKIKGEGSI